VPIVSRCFVILPSPLLGPATYAPLAASLAGRDTSAVVASLPVGEVTPERVLSGFRSEAQRVARQGATVLVAHSNAGYYGAAVAAQLGLPVVYLDAALPVVGESETVLAPAAFAKFVGSLPVRDGLLPPWPSWWPRADIAALFPDDGWLDLVIREAPRLAPTYFTTPIRVPRGWESGPAAYLACGDTYAAELAFAERAGWVVRHESGHHMAHLAQPDHVADLVTAVVDELPATR
jgi:hypothetical protein